MKTKFFLIFLFCYASLAQADHDWKNQIEGFKKTIVNIKSRTEMGLEFDLAGTTNATGFIANAKERIIVTNRHVSQTSPATYEIQFYNGTKTTAKLVYYDPWHDFAFLQFDPPTPSFQISEVTFGKHDQLRDNDEVCMIGNNEVEAYSIKFGRVTKLFINKLSEEFERHTHALLTSFDRAGGSSGSPVFNTKGEVVAIHKAGNNTSSYELRIDYITDALQSILKNKVPARGDIGVKLRMLPISSAVRFYNYPQNEIDQLKKQKPNLQFVLLVDRLLPDSVANAKLKVGDILVEANHVGLNEDVYLFDKIVNQSIGSQVQYKVHRRTGKVEISLPVVDVEKKKINRFVQFAGTLFHEITPTLSIYFNIPSQGVYLTETDLGSSFEWLGNYRRADPSGVLKKRKVVIYEANGKSVRNLDDLIAIFSNLKPGQALALVATDFFEDGIQMKAAEIELSANLSPIAIYEWNSVQRSWLKTN